MDHSRVRVGASVSASIRSRLLRRSGLDDVSRPHRHSESVVHARVSHVVAIALVRIGGIEQHAFGDAC